MNPPDRLGRAMLRLGDAASLMFAIAFVISVLEVALRYLFGAPTSWVHASCTALCVAAFAISGAYSAVRGEHMRVTLLFDRAAPRWQQAGRWLAVACGGLYLAGLAWGTGREAMQSLWRFDAGRWLPELTPGPPNWPLPAIAKAMLLLGVLLFLVAVLRDAWQLLQHRRAGAV